VSGTIYTSEKDNTLRLPFCQEAFLAIVIAEAGRRGIDLFHASVEAHTISLLLQYLSIVSFLLLTHLSDKEIKVLTKMSRVRYSL
jgi:hypothetical protein